jgi:hypothetical protein
MPDDRQPFPDRGHHPVLHPVVDHLYEVAGTAGTAMQVPLGGAPVAGPARRRLRAAPAGGDALEDRVEPGDRLLLAADHEAVATLQAPHPAGGTAVHVVDLVRGELPGAGDVVAVVRVPAVDHHIIRVEQRNQLVKRGLHGRGRHHEPDRTRPVEFRRQIRKRARADHALGGEPLHGALGAGVSDAPVAVLHEPADQVCAHPAQPNHANLHGSLRCHDGPPHVPVRSALPARAGIRTSSRAV